MQEVGVNVVRLIPGIIGKKELLVLTIAQKNERYSHLDAQNSYRIHVELMIPLSGCLNLGIVV